MKKKKGWIVVLVIVLLAALAVGGYFAWQHFSGGAAVEGTAYVQSVSEITGVGYVGQSNRYSGIVESKEVIEINPDSTMTIKECFVEAGDTVTAGLPLFVYDVDELTLAHEQLLIDITGLEGTIITCNEEIVQLDKRIAKAKEADLYDLKLEKQTVELNLKKTTYELEDKKLKSEQMQLIIADSVVTSPVDGIVRSVRSDESSNNPFSYMGGGNESSAYITIVAGSDYCVKGSISEQTVHSIYEGMPVIIRSRVDKNFSRSGEIYMINTESSENSGSQDMYYGMDSGERASKYSFYVSLEDISGLIIGQHVYIELGSVQEEEQSSWKLPSYYLINEDGAYFVYAANSKERIEKRAVTLGQYDEMTDCYEITAGLELQDLIAFPDEVIEVGMKASTTQHVPEVGNDPINNLGGNAPSSSYKIGIDESFGG